MPCHVHGQDDKPTARQLNGKWALHFAGVYIAVADEDRRSRMSGVHASWSVKQARHDHALWAREPDVGHLGSAGGLNHMGEECPRQNQQPSQTKKPEPSHHFRLPRYL